MRKLTHTELLDRQKVVAGQPKIPLTVVLDNIRSVHNVGSMFRACDGCGAECLWLCGITAYPPSPQLSKTALDAEAHVPWEHSRNTAVVVQKLKEQGYHIVLLEQTDSSVNYLDYKPEGPVCLVVGNEIEGVDDKLLALADIAIEIEMAGIKNSLNAAGAFSVAAFHIRNCLKQLQ